MSGQTAESLSSAKAYTDAKTSTLSNTLTSYIDTTKNEILSGTSAFNMNTISARALKGGNPAAVTYQPNRGSSTSASGGTWV